MSRREKKRYLSLLIEEIVVTYGISEDVASKAVMNGPIVQMLDDKPEFVDHVPISSWAKDIYTNIRS